MGITRSQTKWGSVASTVAAAVGAVASDITNHPLLVKVLWAAFAVLVVVSIVLFLMDRGDERTSVGPATQKDSPGAAQFQAGSMTVGSVTTSPPPSRLVIYTQEVIDVANALLALSRRMDQWRQEEGFSVDGFRERFLDEYQALYGALTSAGYGTNSTLERLFNGPRTEKDFNAMLGQIHHVHASANAYGPTR